MVMSKEQKSIRTEIRRTAKKMTELMEIQISCYYQSSINGNEMLTEKGYEAQKEFTKLYNRLGVLQAELLTKYGETYSYDSLFDEKNML